jgi:hypothetical protein
MRKAILTLLVVAASAAAWAQGSIEYVRRIHGWEDELHLDSREVLGDTWTCALGASTCNAVLGSVNTVALASGDSVICQTTAGKWWSWSVDGTPASLDTFERLRVLPDGTVDSMPAVTGSTCYRIGLGVEATLAPVDDGTGLEAPLSLSTTGIGVGIDAPGGTVNTPGKATFWSKGDNAFHMDLDATTMTGDAVFTLPADEPAAESWLTMGTDGQVDYTPISGETLAAVTARGATTSTPTTFSNGITASDITFVYDNMASLTMPAPADESEENAAAIVIGGATGPSGTGTNGAGSGSSFSMFAGSGGAAVNNPGGQGGSFVIESGAGGDSTNDVGSSGGAIEITTGDGGNGTDGGPGGSITLIAGSGGAGSAGPTGDGGSISLYSGGSGSSAEGNIILDSGDQGYILARGPLVVVGEDKTAGTPNIDGTIKLWSNGDNDYFTTLMTGTQTQAVTYTLPLDDGAAGEALTTNGSGVLDWAAVGGTSAFTSTVTVDVDGGNAAVELLELSNTDDTGAGSWGQVARIRSEFNSSTDSGVNWAMRDGAYIDFYKELGSDYYTGSGTADMDSGIKFGAVQNGTDRSQPVMTIQSDGQVRFNGGYANGGIDIFVDGSSYSYYYGTFNADMNLYDYQADSIFLNKYYLGMEGSTKDDYEMLGAFVSNRNAYANAADETAVFAWSRGEAQTVADNGGGTPATFTLTPESFISLHRVTCNDANGCTATVAETYSWDGQTSMICNVATYPITVADSSGVVELRGGESAVLGPYDCLTLVYSDARYLEQARTIAAGATSTYGITGQTQGVEHVKVHVTHSDILTASGAGSLSANLNVMTIPARSRVTGAAIIVTEQGVATNTVICGLHGDQLIMSGSSVDLKSAVGTVLGQNDSGQVGEIFDGAGTFGGWIYTSAETIVMNVTCGANCDSITYSAGEYDIIVSYEVLP